MASFVVLILVIGILYSFEHKHDTTRSVVKVGVLMPLSGDLAAFGDNVKKGIDIASKNFPSNKFEIIYEDTKGMDNNHAISSYHKLADVDKVNIIIGPFGPEQMLTIAPLTEKQNIPVFGVSLCEERLRKYSTLFCIYPSNEEQIKSAMPHIKSLGLKRLVLVTENEALGDVISNGIKESSSLGGYVVVGEERGKRGDSDFRSIILKIKRQNPDIIYSVLAPTDGHIFLKQLHELGYSGVNFTQLDTTEERLKDFGLAMEGVYFPGHIDENFERNFVTTYKIMNKNEPDMYVALGHSTAQLLLSTLEENNWEADSIKENIVERLDDKTAIKGFRFRKDHTVSIPLKTLQFKNGEFGDI